MEAEEDEGGWVDESASERAASGMGFYCAFLFGL